jgi:preprotein translocase subunit SecG
MLLFFIIVLAVVLVLDCAVLALLVLIQLPKKEAGAGLAFGGAASDALFGAGSGNVLTKITKWAAALFIVLSILISAMQSSYWRRTATSQFPELLRQPQAPMGAPTGTAPAPTAPVAPPANSTKAPSASAPAAEVPATAPATETPAPATPDSSATPK